MKKFILTLGILVSFTAFAQDHFSSISTSSRVGILNASVNPAELANLYKKFEVNISGFSFNVSNNKISSGDLNSDTNLKELIFTGTDPVNMRIDGQILGPGVAVKLLKWGFGITTKANVKFDIVNVDPVIGNAISNNNLILNTTLLNHPENQRLSGASYGEVGFSVARTLVNSEKHSFGVGVTFNLLFPGSYSNFGLSGLNGQITQNASGAYLTTNQPATLNIAYSGSLANSFSNFGDYTRSIFGGLNGMATDIGATYQWKDGKTKKYRIKGGIAIRNIGSMTFKDNNNYSTSYTLMIQPTLQNPQGLDLSLFNNVNNLSEVETILTQNGYLTKAPEKRDFTVNLPTLFTMYGDFRIIPKIYITGYWQQKMKKDNADNQITALNIFSVTPRVNLGLFEFCLPVSTNDIAGTNVGIGIRLSGFYLGSNSFFSSLANSSKQADLYTGFRWAFL
jgi:hypothetical protein